MAYQVDENQVAIFAQVLQEFTGIDYVSFTARFLECPCTSSFNVTSNTEIKDLIQDIKVHSDLKLHHKRPDDNGDLVVGLYKQDGYRMPIRALCRLTLRTGEDGMARGEVEIAGETDGFVQDIRNGINHAAIISTVD